MHVIIKNRWDNKTIYECDVDGDEPDIALGLAIRKALADGASLNCASLNCASLDGASLDGASLNCASLNCASLDGASLDGARLDGASLNYARLNGTILDNASLNGARLVGANLRNASLNGARLDGARLVGASLDGASLNYASLDGASLNCVSLNCASLNGAILRGIPIVPNIDAAILQSISDNLGLFGMETWHSSCGTSHCRAGWAITLAGLDGKNLEDKIGTAAAGALIYAASRPGKPVPNFFAATDAALADIRACAVEESV